MRYVVKILLFIVAFIVALFFSGCGGGKKNNSASTTHRSNNKIIVYNDSFDPDFVPLVLGSIYAKKALNYDISFIVEGKDTQSKTAMLYDCIAKYYNANIDVGLNKNAKRIAKYKTTKELQNYCPNSYTDNVYKSSTALLLEQLESAEDDSVTIVTGGELYALSDFVNNEYNLELFKLKVNKVIIATGCDILKDSPNCRDFNLGRDKATADATANFLNKIRKPNDPLAIRMIAITNNINHNIRALDYYKQHPTNSPIKYILNQNQYGTFGDHHKGDLEALLLATNQGDFKLIKQNIHIDFNGKALIVKDKGVDLIYKDNTNYNSLMLNIFKVLDK